MNHKRICAHRTWRISHEYRLTYWRWGTSFVVASDCFFPVFWYRKFGEIQQEIGRLDGIYSRKTKASQFLCRQNSKISSHKSRNSAEGFSCNLVLRKNRKQDAFTCTLALRFVLFGFPNGKGFASLGNSARPRRRSRVQTDRHATRQTRTREKLD